MTRPIKQIPTLVCILIFQWFVVGNSVAQSFRQIGTGDNVVLEAPVQLNCTKAIPVRVRTNSAMYFENERNGLQQLMGVARIALSFECPAITQLQLSGFVDGLEYLKGRATKANAWALVIEPSVLQPGDQAAQNNVWITHQEGFPRR